MPVFRPVKPRLVTPSVLLLSRQIYFEAQELLGSKCLTIDCPPPKDIMSSKDPDITDFISELTIQKVQHVTLIMDFTEHK